MDFFNKGDSNEYFNMRSFNHRVLPYRKDTTNTLRGNATSSPTSRRATCHICDIDFPVAYRAQHESSLKHRAYVKIAEGMLNRTRKQMLKTSDGYSYFHRNANTYFCRSCATEVDIDYRQSHDGSNTHRQWALLDELLADLVVLFTDDRRDDESSTLNKATHDINIHGSGVRDTFLISDISARLNEFKIQTMKNNINPGLMSQESVAVNAINHNKLYKYGSTAPNGFNEGSYHSNAPSNQLLRSIAANKTKPTYTAKSNTFIKLDNVTYLCTVCNIELHINSVEPHKNGLRHADHSKSNVHFHMTRYVGCDGLVCRVCDVEIADDVSKVVSHVATSDHALKYIAMLKNNHVTEHEDNFYCKPCNLVIRKKNELVHIQKLSHENKLARFQGKVDVQKPTRVNKAHSNAELPCSNIARVSSDIKCNSHEARLTGKIKSYYCDICKVNIPNNPYDISAHNDEGRHKRNAAGCAYTVNSDVVYSDDEELEIHYQMNDSDMMLFG